MEDSEDDEEETLEGRLARLRREIEELKVQVGEREEREEREKRVRRERKAAAVGEEGAEEGEEGNGAALPEEEEADANEGIDGKRLRTGISELSDALETIQSPSIKPTTSHTRHGRAEANLARKIVSSLGTSATTQEPTDGPQELPSSTTTTSPPSPHPQPSYTITYAPTFHQSHSLARAADFDHRLTTLERLLGTTHSSTTHLSNLDKHLPANAIIPTLDDLARQISVLTSSNQPFVEALNRRVKMLTDQAEKLTEARRSAARAAVLEGASNSASSGLGGLGSGVSHVGAGVTRRATVSTALVGASAGTGGGDDDTHSQLTHSATYGSLGAIDTDRETKINALYGVLPTIQQLGPLLPSVLDRLRSLRAIHADAGRAAEGLEGIEKRQEEMSLEIGRWREALGKVEGVMKETEGVFMGNVGKVEEWVRGLEERMEKVEKLYSGGGEAGEGEGK